MMGVFMLAVGSSGANAQGISGLNVSAAVKAVEAEAAGKPSLAQAGAVLQKAVATTTAVTLGNGTIYQSQPATSVTVKLNNVASEAAWLRSAGWQLYALVDRFADTGDALDEQSRCIAVAVYHEARGENLEGQLAVAKVIMNRAASGKYPSSWCATVKQPWQFSFVNPRSGAFPYTDTNSNAWRKAVAITKLAVANAVPTLSNDVLWYHADYVAPSWGRRLSFVQKIGTHIFYRA
ncbi:cell wall hydrolase [Sphingomonas lutea]|uniref:Cell wall hydrolase n=2 Tax=Sphingomonas lutea TaxID=1045317 RepID=A0A7G9SH75_9SPHN|nr:cell wall hydrolase [Sphingomonas lutea]